MLNQTGLSQASLDQIEMEAAKYPAERRSSAIMAALTIAQDEHQFLSKELIEHVASIIGIPPVRAYEVATFYSMYQHKPCGENVIKVCTNISCMLRGSGEVVSHLESRLGIKLGEVTADGKIGLQEVECLAACAGAPMLQLNKQYVENLTPESIDEMLESLS
ncbi:MAG: NADH-quinone oxidoreductase subunit E [Saprospiraceae bacterium]|jgi:NADH-quinone oxidoreductase subunit E